MYVDAWMCIHIHSFGHRAYIHSKYMMIYHCVVFVSESPCLLILDSAEASISRAFQIFDVPRLKCTLARPDRVLKNGSLEDSDDTSFWMCINTPIGIQQSNHNGRILVTIVIIWFMLEIHALTNSHHNGFALKYGAPWNLYSALVASAWERSTYRWKNLAIHRCSPTSSAHLASL